MSFKGMDFLSTGSNWQRFLRIKNTRMQQTAKPTKTISTPAFSVSRLYSMLMPDMPIERQTRMEENSTPLICWQAPIAMASNMEKPGIRKKLIMGIKNAKMTMPIILIDVDTAIKPLNSAAAIADINKYLVA